MSNDFMDEIARFGAFMAMHRHIKSEVERIAELENEGYEESGRLCHLCGAGLMEKGRNLNEGAPDEVWMTLFVCPSCENSFHEYE